MSPALLHRVRDSSIQQSSERAELGGQRTAAAPPERTSGARLPVLTLFAQVPALLASRRAILGFFLRLLFARQAACGCCALRAPLLRLRAHASVCARRRSGIQMVSSWMKMFLLFCHDDKICFFSRLSVGELIIKKSSISETIVIF